MKPKHLLSASLICFWIALFICVAICNWGLGLVLMLVLAIFLCVLVEEIDE